MQIAISCIAWNPHEDQDAASILESQGITAVELVPARLRDGNPVEVKAVWQKHSVDISAMQALLFGYPSLQLFGDLEARNQLQDVLAETFALGGKVGIKRYVFGSPKNRIRGPLSFDDALNSATDFFRGVAKAANASESCLCIEANPKEYGCDFIQTTNEAWQLVQAVSDPGFGLHLDTGGIFLNNENLEETFALYLPLANHLHISAPNLVPIYNYEKKDRLRVAMELIRKSSYSGNVSIEMQKRPTDISLSDHIKRALEVIL